LQICKYGGGYGPDYGELSTEYVNKKGFVRYWDDEAKAPYLFDGSTFLSYDDPESLKLKAEYVKEHGYAGCFYWEHKCDKTRALLNTLHDNLLG
ncbi:MAG: chitinase, partial [Lachnospiraceae bacterium]|nr:chitinase [Lachnospiraceae bacterium]